MARFYQVTARSKKSDAVELATALSNHLKREGFPSKTKITEVSGGYVIWSEATVKQITAFHDWINRDPIKDLVVTKREKADLKQDSPEFQKYFGALRKRNIKENKAELAARKAFITTRKQKRG